MTIEELAKLVEQMRSLQKRFFRGERTVVAEAKRVEKQVDEAVERVLHPERNTQQELFQ